METLPTHAEVYTNEQLEVHARAIAVRHKLSATPGRDRLLGRLDGNEAVIQGIAAQVASALAKGRRTAPAGESLIANTYLIEEHVRTARRHLPRRYSRELPQLASGSLAGYPRVYALVLELITHLDGSIDADVVDRFVAAYQEASPLQLGELWAVPIMLRLALIENLRVLSGSIAVGRQDRDLADLWATRLIRAAQKQPASVVLILANLARSEPTLRSGFVAEFARRLRGQIPAVSLALIWMDQRLSEQSRSIEEAVSWETQRQAADQVSIGNTLGSLRMLSAIDWRAFVEKQSAIERALRADPAGAYASSDFATRDKCRRMVERLSKQSGLPEPEIAARAIALCEKASREPGALPCANHVGYYLLDDGLRTLEADVGARIGLVQKAGRIPRKAPLTFYLGSSLAATCLIAATFAIGVPRHGIPPWACALGGAALALAASQFAIAVVNWLVGALVPPRMLPRMDFSRGIPPPFRTVVVVPVMLASEDAILEHIEFLEVRFLANRDSQLSFALLSDFADAPRETMPDDARLLETARRGIEALNARYAASQPGAFLLCHRARTWNAAEGVWMGYERKRGKLEDFNTLLRQGPPGGFAMIVGNTAALAGARFVITLDADTDLPRNAGRELVAALAHPLVQPQFDEARGRIVHGYAILQPRVAISLASYNRSRFARIFAGEPGIDPYTHLVSDVYQDLFREGSFVGKGIYDAAVFQKSVEGRFPANRILSHDLIEGCHARTALVSDILLYEEHPWHYTADAARRHRWIRGDWQIAPWLLPRVPWPEGKSGRNPLSRLSRWKILDNLRRSVAPVAMLVLVILGWMFLPSPLFALAFVAAFLLVPPFVQGISDLLHVHGDEVSFGLHASLAGHRFCRQALQVAIGLVFLPFEAVLCLDAMGRSLWRMAVSNRRLLEWQTASEAARLARRALGSFFLTMASGPAVAAISAAMLVAGRPGAIPAASPVIVLWALSPVLAWWLSSAPAAKGVRITASQQRLLRRTARRTWSYFDSYVSAEDHFLPPDNHQDAPLAATAHRTSPTNIGASLLSTLAAFDFGYVSAPSLIERTRRTFLTLEKLERYRGHFYNWYDTLTLQVLPRPYVSTVDSGNLAGFLLVLRQGLLELPDRPILHERALTGIADMVLVLREQLRQGAKEAKPRDGRGRADAEGEAAAMLEALGSPAADMRSSARLLQRMRESADVIFRSLAMETDAEILWAAESLARQTAEVLESLSDQAPWLFEAPLEGLEALETASTPRAIAELARSHSPEAARMAEALCQEAEVLAGQCLEFSQMDFKFLFDDIRKQMSIGFVVPDRQRDPSYYDLLASEARLASFVAIAQGQVPQEHWFALGRRLVAVGGEPTLLSWSGSMFEYLMPQLVMPSYSHSLLDSTNRVAVDAQVRYGDERGVPWGISESGYNATDPQLNYLYRAFGVPGLGFKRGLAQDLVVAPYATVMAMMIEPERACANLERLRAEGAVGRHGFYEAVDYTPERIPAGQDRAIVRSFMAHHQGMSLLSLAHHMLDRPMQRRFMAEPLFRATSLLLQERIPNAARLSGQAETLEPEEPVSAAPEAPARIYTTAQTPSAEIHILSNGRYHVMISAAGSGYSRWNDLAITRWREDPTRDCWGSYCYIRDARSRAFWSAAYQPAMKSGMSYEVHFQQARADFHRSDADIITHTQVSVSPEDDVEVRRIKLTNRSRVRRTIELTSYAEVVLAHPAADASHPAFSNLFVETSILRDRRAILGTRRPRSPGESPPWMIHLMAVSGLVSDTPSFETDRARFIGRGRSLASPAAMLEPRLSDTDGSTLDPIVSIRQTLVLDPDQSAVVSIVTGAAKAREEALALVDKYRDSRLCDRVFELAWSHSDLMMRQLNAGAAEAKLFGRLMGSIVHPTRLRRADPGLLARNRRGQSALWSYSISGDHPILLLRIADQANIEIVRQLLLAHAYWRTMKGLSVDLVILNEDHSGYRRNLQERIMALIGSSTEAGTVDRPGGIFVRHAEQMPEEDRILLQSVARVVISDGAGTLAEQVDRPWSSLPEMPRLLPARRRTAETPTPSGEARLADESSLLFFNGIGGFSPDGREYVIGTRVGRSTPAPWVNVIANSRMGTIVSESGGGYTWAENAHEYRLTPWSNDPVCDTCGEGFYIRDDESAEFWSPAPLPARGETPYTCRHGAGCTVFEHLEKGIRSELTIFVAADAPVKFGVFRIFNESGRARRLSVTGYWEWVLGETREKCLMHTVTEIDPQTQALLARNYYNADFADRVAFADVNDSSRSVSGDRTEFLGRNGSAEHPAALGRTRLSGRTGAGFDPCAAIQVAFTLADQDQREVVFILGAGRGEDEARNLVRRFRGAQAARETLASVRNYWNRTLGTVSVDTPDKSVDLMANGWLLYQTLACRIWGRSGFYQSGGAYGFRDQLQDAMALVHAEPRLLREHLLRCAGRQFHEGDVQHWWHPPTGRGVRTRISDDYLWLPVATCRYIEATGDDAVLRERAPFLEGRAVKAEEDAYFDLPAVSRDEATLYDHCVRAVQHGLNFGAHGLPLMGTGDWNDGMNLVGEHGRGESVWLAFFLHSVLAGFAPLARSQGDEAFARRCESEAAKLRVNIERDAWDGSWYRRAYFDNGEPLGSASNAECQIDALPQSWAVISGAADPARQRQAMDAVDRRLVRREAGLIQLFDPPFDTAPDVDAPSSRVSSPNPGYIKGYPPGVRENGGQYTHAAVWTVMAFALLGDAPRAWELFAMINPVGRGGEPDRIARYAVEPYVVAADVHGVPPRLGRGGWTWYTGSAGWMYRLLVEVLLGIVREGNRLRVSPRLPESWPGFALRYRFGETLYRIAVSRAREGAGRVVVDGTERPDGAILLADDRAEHNVQIECAPAPGPLQELPAIPGVQ